MGSAHLAHVAAAPLSPPERPLPVREGASTPLAPPPRPSVLLAAELPRERDPLALVLGGPP